jgi:hypothetical protein
LVYASVNDFSHPELHRLKAVPLFSWSRSVRRKYL